MGMGMGWMVDEDGGWWMGDEDGGPWMSAAATVFFTKIQTKPYTYVSVE